MSEFSESYHLRASDQREGVALLERAGMAGWVFPATNGWCALVPERDLVVGVPDEAIVAANQGLFVFYVNAEDHGWRFALYEGPEELASYEVDWSDGVPAPSTDLDLRRLHDWLPTPSDEAWQQVETILRAPAGNDAGLGGRNPGHRFARAIGLSNYERVSGPYLAAGGQRDYPTAVHVAGTVMDTNTMIRMALYSGVDLGDAPDAAMVLAEARSRSDEQMTVPVSEMQRVEGAPDGLNGKDFAKGARLGATFVVAPASAAGATVHVCWDDGRRIAEDLEMELILDGQVARTWRVGARLDYSEQPDCRLSVAWPHTLRRPGVRLHYGADSQSWWAVVVDFR